MKRYIPITIAVLLFAAWFVPRIGAGQYRGPAQAALEKALGRKVEIGDLKFRLLPMPGLTISNVVIGEDPKIGYEPVAYVTTLRAVPRIGSLFGGTLEFSSVDLEDAAVNLTRVDQPPNGVAWNFASLLAPATLTAFPSVHLRGGRINFKFGDTKSIFYLLNTDVDLWPPDSANGPWTLKIHAYPARTDRPARNGFGSFVARGQWRQSDNSTTLDAKLEQSELGDMLTLFNGYESGFHGDISGDAHLAGPLNRIGIAGRMTVSDIHGWNQTPPGGSGWKFAIGGAIDATGQTIDLSAKVAGNQSPLELRYRVSDYLRRPRWGVTVNLNRFPLTPVPEIARNLGLAVPADYRFDGEADGAVGYSMPDGAPRMDGTMNLSSATIVVAGTPPLHLPGAELHFSGSAITLEPTQVSNEGKESATIAGSWDLATRKLAVELSSGGMSIASLRRQVAVAGIPLLSQATSGIWKGDLRFNGDSWAGDINLADADIPFEAFAEPLHVVSADAAIDAGGGTSIKRVSLTVGGIPLQGEYRYEASSKRPHKFRINVPEASGPALERLLLPTLRRGNFLTYAFNFGRVPEPDWLRNMHADGTIQTGRFELGGGTFSKLRARVVWDGTEVVFNGLETQFGDARFKGSASIHLAGRQPAYDVTGKLSGLAWRNGTIGADGVLSTSGTGTALLANMKAKGSFDGQDIELAAPDVYDAVTGTFEWAWDARSPKLRLPELVMVAGPDTWLGSAAMEENGQLVVKVSDGTKHLQASGAILRGEALKPIAP